MRLPPGYYWLEYGLFGIELVKVSRKGTPRALTQFHQVSYCSHDEESNTNSLWDLDEFATISYWEVSMRPTTLLHLSARNCGAGTLFWESCSSKQYWDRIKSWRGVRTLSAFSDKLGAIFEEIARNVQEFLNLVWHDCGIVELCYVRLRGEFDEAQ